MNFLGHFETLSEDAFILTLSETSLPEKLGSCDIKT